MKRELDSKFLSSPISFLSLNQLREFDGREEALKFLEIAAERHNLEAAYILGNFYRWGCLLTQTDTSPPDFEKALEYYQRVADAVDIEDSCPSDYEYWPDCWPDIAIAVNYVANTYKDLMYKDVKSIEKACIYFQKLIRIHESWRAFQPNLKAMDLDFCRAYLFMARCFRDGLGVESNLAKSNEYFQMVIDFEKQNIVIDNYEATSFYKRFEVFNPKALQDIKINQEAKSFYEQLWHIPQRQPLSELLQDFKKEKTEGQYQLYTTLLDRFQYPSPEDGDVAQSLISSLESEDGHDLIVGLAYQFGFGVMPDLPKALNYFQSYQVLSADHPHRDMLASQLIECCYQQSDGMEHKHHARAKALYEVETKNGNPALKIKDKIFLDLLLGNFIKTEFAVNLGSTRALSKAAHILNNYKSFKLMEIAAERNENQALSFYFENYHHFHDKEQYIPTLISYQKKLLSIIESFEIRFKEKVIDSYSHKENIVLYFNITKKIADILHSEPEYKNTFNYNNNQLLQYFDKKLGYFGPKDKQLLSNICYPLAICYRNAGETVENLQKYFEYLTKAATLFMYTDHTLKLDILYQLAFCYAQGIGTEKNVNEFLRTYIKFYDMGRPEHSHATGLALLIGKIAIADFKEPHSQLALLKFFHAAINGSREGLYLLIKNFSFRAWSYCLQALPVKLFHTSNTQSFLQNCIILKKYYEPADITYGSNTLYDLTIRTLPLLFFYGSALYTADGFSKQTYDEKMSGEDPAGKIMLACFYQNGIAGMKKNPGKAMQLLQEQAEAGVGLACFLQGFAFAMGIECKTDLAAAAFLYRKAIFFHCDALEFLATLSRENPRDLKIMYHYCMSDIEKLVEQLDKKSNVFFRLWAEEYQSLPNSEFKNFSLSKMHEAAVRMSRSLAQYFLKSGQNPWCDKVFYQVGMYAIENGISKNIRMGVELFSLLSPENLSPSENFDAGFFLFNLRISIEYLQSQKISEKIYAHWQKAAVDGNFIARRYLLSMAASRFASQFNDPVFSGIYPHYVDEDELFLADNFIKFQADFFERLTGARVNDVDQKSSATSKSLGRRLSGLFPDFIVQHEKEKDEFISVFQNL